MIRIEHGIRRSVLLESGGCCSCISIDVLSAVRGPCHLTVSQLDRTSDRGVHEHVELFVSEMLAVDAVVG